jgi:hypothetical protein
LREVFSRLFTTETRRAQREKRKAVVVSFSSLCSPCLRGEN